MHTGQADRPMGSPRAVSQQAFPAGPAVSAHEGMSLYRCGDQIRIVADPSRRDALVALVARHEAVVHPHVPRVLSVSLASDPLEVRLAFAMTCTAQQLWDRLTDGTLRLPYAAGSWLAQQVAAVYALLHVSGGALGRGSWSNVLLDEQGRVGVLLCAPLSDRHVCAPEVAAGGMAAPASDVHVIWSMQQPLLAVADLPDKMRAALVGESTDEDYLRIFLTLQQRAGATRAGERFEDLRAGLAAWEALWDALQVWPEEESWLRFFADAVPSDGANSLRVHDGLGFIELPNGEPIDLTRYSVLRRTLAVLIKGWRETPGVGVPVEVFVEEVWPGEQIVVHAARNRVYVALSRLRALGMENLLLRGDQGYFLDPDIRVRSVHA